MGSAVRREPRIASLAWAARRALGIRWGRPRPRAERLVVYTAIFGAIPDALLAPAGFRRDPSVEYFCFTDRPERVGGGSPWIARPPAWSHADPRRSARFHKTQPHLLFPDAGYSLWLDGNIQLASDPWAPIDAHLGSGADVAAFSHRLRDCLYEELEACIRLKKDDPEVMRRQVERYRSLGYPAHHGLAETGVLARRHSAPVAAFDQAWWDEISSGSVRDQISFPFVLWRQGLAFSPLRGETLRSPYVRYVRHR